jgi:peptidyl-tRNA hydrolase, PTH2 family
MSVKQVIVVRKDLKMRRGKEIAQGAHACVAWLADRVMELSTSHPEEIWELEAFSSEEKEWMTGNFTKVCVRVDSEEELMRIYAEAKKARLTVNLITDAGLTEFDGIPTRTCLAIGPNYSENIDKITGELKLY